MSLQITKVCVCLAAKQNGRAPPEKGPEPNEHQAITESGDAAADGGAV